MSQNPWCESGESGTTIETTFEDNFASASVEKLPDSEEYLKSLGEKENSNFAKDFSDSLRCDTGVCHSFLFDIAEKKLNKLKSNSSVLKQLADRREECMEKLLSGAIDLSTNSDLDFDDSSNRPVLELVRHIIPEQAVNSTELVHIIKHDHLAATESTDDDVDQQNQTESKN